MAESYDELKKECEKVKQERDKDRRIVSAMRDQIDKLKQIIKATAGMRGGEKIGQIQSISSDLGTPREE